MKRILQILTISTLFLYGIPDVHAATINVSTGQSIQSKVASASSGDTIQVQRGVYNERITLDKPLILVCLEARSCKTQGFAVTGNNVSVEGFYITNTISSQTGGNGFYITGDHCLISDNYIYNTPTRGIFIRPESNGCIVKGNTVEHAGWSGIDVDGTNHTIENNEIIGIVQHHPYGALDDDANGFNFYGSGHIFRGNNIHGMSYDGKDITDAHVDCFQTYYANTHDILFDGNICDLPIYKGGSNGSWGWMLNSASNITFQNNLIRAMGCFYKSGAGLSNLTYRNNGCAELNIDWDREVLVSIPPFPTLPDMSVISPTYTPVPSALPVPTEVSGKPADANRDGKVDGVDYIVWLNHYSQSVSGAVNGNFDGNNGVDGVDYIVWLNNYGK